MPLKPRRQNGFTAVAAMLFVIMLTLIAGVGYYIYDTSKDSATDTPSKPTTQAQQPASDAGQFLDIPAWGVRLPIPKVTPDLYAVKASNGTGYNLSVHSLDTVDACAADKTGLASLIRVAAKQSVEPDAGTPYTAQDIAASPQIGNYRYLIVSGNGTCTDPSNPAWQTAQAAVIDLKNSAQALTITP